MKEVVYKKKYIVREDGTIFKKMGYKFQNGYQATSICGKRMYVHRIVWEAFNGKIPEDKVIDHIIPISNGGTNELSNLRLVTEKENHQNEFSIENYKISNNKKAKYQAKKVDQIDPETGEVIAQFDSILKAAKWYGYNDSGICSCTNGRISTYKKYIWKKVAP